MTSLASVRCDRKGGIAMKLTIASLILVLTGCATTGSRATRPDSGRSETTASVTLAGDAYARWVEHRLDVFGARIEAAVHSGAIGASAHDQFLAHRATVRAMERVAAADGTIDTRDRERIEMLVNDMMTECGDGLRDRE